MTPQPEKVEPVFTQIPEDDATPPVPANDGAVATDNTIAIVANDNAAKAASQTAAPVAHAKTVGKGKKALAIAFNMAAGATLTAGAKIGVGMLAASFAVPALATLVASAVAVGVVSSMWCHHGQNKALKKQGLATQGFWSKEKRKHNLKTFLISSGFAAVGGALYLGFEEQINSFFGSLFGKPEVAPIQTLVAPVVPSATDKIADIIASGNASTQVHDALARSLSANATVAAQGTKDLAYFSFNGLGGLPKDQSLALELFNKAADAGNVQAKVDLAYVQYHGLAGVPADQNAALSSLQEVNTGKAKMFVKAWTR